MGREGEEGEGGGRKGSRVEEMRKKGGGEECELGTLGKKGRIGIILNSGPFRGRCWIWETYVCISDGGDEL